MRVGLWLKLLLVFCYILWLPSVWRNLDSLGWLIYHSGGDGSGGLTVGGDVKRSNVTTAAEHDAVVKGDVVDSNVKNLSKGWYHLSRKLNK